ncbi:hypothetical protein [Amycolatopsis antarctica]|uniref:hypothetical protein n=1 Tax=Amycolatopsis antarctica TaxID=1854586 RepID=UPI001055A76A|nr:hypothetical protein [Amycolatopsis antarctica]
MGFVIEVVFGKAAVSLRTGVVLGLSVNAARSRLGANTATTESPDTPWHWGYRAGHSFSGVVRPIRARLR